MDAHEKILLINKELTKEQIMPKNFVFYNPEEHKQIISLLEEKNPKAIICVTGCVEDISGGFYPFPIFEDGDFDIPSVYMKNTDGEKVIKLTGQKVELAIESKRIPAKGYNIIARKKGEGKGRLVLCAHIDTKKNTPGALDNATGVAVLMALAEQLRNYKGPNDIEIVAFNGEDYYSVPGQMLYLKQNNEDYRKLYNRCKRGGMVRRRPFYVSTKRSSLYCLNIIKCEKCCYEHYTYAKGYNEQCGYRAVM